MEFFCQRSQVKWWLMWRPVKDVRLTFRRSPSTGSNEVSRQNESERDPCVLGHFATASLIFRGVVASTSPKVREMARFPTGGDACSADGHREHAVFPTRQNLNVASDSGLWAQGEGPLGHDVRDVNQPVSACGPSKAVPSAGRGRSLHGPKRRSFPIGPWCSLIGDGKRPFPGFFHRQLCAIGPKPPKN